MWIFIQARSTSKRLPNKVMKKIGDKTLLQHVIDNCKQVHDQVAVLIPKDDPIKIWLIANNILYWEGSENNVFDRYYSAAKAFGADSIVRITSDCPFVPSDQMFYMINSFIQNDVNYMTNAPCIDGHDIQIADFNVLNWLNDNIEDDYDKEHVFTYIDSHLLEFHTAQLKSAQYKSGILREWVPKLSIDTEEDLERVREIFKKLKEQ